MFAQSSADQLRASSLANEHTKGWEQLLALRISLQKSIDIGNKLPADDFEDVYKGNDELAESKSDLTDNLRAVLGDLTNIMNVQAENVPSDKTFTAPTSSKRKRTSDITWEEVCASQDHMDSYWEKVVNKWHARLNFGSEQNKNKLKTFNHSIWNQIDETLNSESRVIEKSRMPELESKRLSFTSKSKTSSYYNQNDESDHEEEGEDDDFNADKQQVDRKTNKTFDMEVYDDRSFYSMLLKTFITSSSAAASQGAGTNGTLFGSSLRGDDLEALRKYKRKKLDVERKASKGRKIRYTVHTKLQNFMFPVPLIPPSHLDVERLHASLFQ